jgi:hypothetical protein
MPQGARPEPAEPRWPALLALLAVSGITMALPASLTVGPRWLVLVLVVVVLVPTVVSHRRGQHALNHVLGMGVNSLVTVAMVGSLALLIKALPTRQESPEALLGSAAALWVTNILVFASWYWRLDAGGAPPAGAADWACRWCVPVPPDDDGDCSEGGRWGVGVVPGVCRLPVSGLQHEHGPLADGRTRALPVGQAAQDAPGDDLLDHRGVARSPRRQYSLSR